MMRNALIRTTTDLRPGIPILYAKKVAICLKTTNLSSSTTIGDVS